VFLVINVHQVKREEWSLRHGEGTFTGLLQERLGFCHPRGGRTRAQITHRQWQGEGGDNYLE